MKTIYQTQQADLAGRIKLTTVSVYVSPGKHKTLFLHLRHDSQGRAILPMHSLNSILTDMQAPRGATFSIS